MSDAPETKQQWAHVAEKVREAAGVAMGYKFEGVGGLLHALARDLERDPLSVFKELHAADLNEQPSGQ